MPQLNPAPWFFTFLISWFIILILLTPKLSSSSIPHQLESKPHTQTLLPWTWPWS